MHLRPFIGLCEQHDEGHRVLENRAFCALMSLLLLHDVLQVTFPSHLSFPKEVAILLQLPINGATTVYKEKRFVTVTRQL